MLGAAGLLRGYRATTHWSAMDHLAPFGATPTKTRVCVDRNRVTGGGVTAGIDFALTLVSLLVDRQTAEAIQLRLEYNPAPPFNSGLARHRAAGNPRAHERENRAYQQRRGEAISAPPRGWQRKPHRHEDRSIRGITTDRAPSVCDKIAGRGTPCTVLGFC